jgi:hypothetical protein
MTDFTSADDIRLLRSHGWCKWADGWRHGGKRSPALPLGAAVRQVLADDRWLNQVMRQGGLSADSLGE